MGVFSALIVILFWLSFCGAFVHFCFSLSAHVIAWRECWLSTPVWCDHGIVHLNCLSIKIFSNFGGFVHFDSDPLGLSSYGAFVHFCFSLSAHVIAWRECWLSTPVSGDHGFVHLDCFSIKIFFHFGGFCPLWFWSFFGFRPVVLLSILAFLCPHTWLHDENVDCPHLYQVITGSYTLIVLVLKYFLILGSLARFDSDPLLLSSYGASVHFCFSLSTHVIAWRECWLSTPVSGDHGFVHLDCFSIKIFSYFWGFSLLWLWSFFGFRSVVLLSIFAFLCPPTWSHDKNVDYQHLYHVIIGSCTLIVWVLKYFVILGVLSALILTLWGFRPMALMSIFSFLCLPTWSHDENVDCPHLYQVIMGSYTLIVLVLKYFFIFGGFVRFDSDPFLAFVLWCFCPF